MKINRRTFLKATAVTVIGLPALPAIAKREQQWIPLKEQFPEKGQHIIMLEVWEGVCTQVEVGQVNSVCQPVEYNGKPLKPYATYLGKYLLLEIDFSLYRHDHNDPLKGHYDLSLNSNSANYSAKEILNTPWVKAERFVDFSMGLVPFYEGSSSIQCWMPVSNRLPQTLPPFPTELKKSVD